MDGGCPECGNGVFRDVSGALVLAPDTDRLCPVGQALWDEVLRVRRDAPTVGGAPADDRVLDALLDAGLAFSRHWRGPDS